MKLLTEILPILAFFIAFKLFDIFIATGVAIAITVLQMVWLKAKNQPISKMQYFNFFIILIFGGLTILLHDKTFIMLKPTILYWSMALGLAISFYVFKKNLIELVLGKEIQLKDGSETHVWSKVNLSWVVYFVFLGALNLYVAKTYSEETWVNFKLSTIGLLLIFVIIQGIWLAKYIKSDSMEPGQ
jgi:intracellular septation protein